MAGAPLDAPSEHPRKQDCVSSPRSHAASEISMSVDSLSDVPSSTAASRHAAYVTKAQSSSLGNSALAKRSCPYFCASGGGASGGDGGRGEGAGEGGGKGMPA